MSDDVQGTRQALAGASASHADAARAYRVCLASSAAEVRLAQALRFDVFNLELDEGLVDSYDTGLDADPFDAQCVHLLVTEVVSNKPVGTYRMQTGRRAAEGLGYYSAREFDLAPFEDRRAQILELGRACIDAQHRNFAVLNLLWKGIAAYAQAEGSRYLLGCSSFTSQDPALGLAAWKQLQAHQAEPSWQTRPKAGFECISTGPVPAAPKVPRLLAMYLALGAKLCGPPAIDREFRTVDFLTWIDVQSPGILALQRRGRFTA